MTAKLGTVKSRRIVRELPECDHRGRRLMVCLDPGGRVCRLKVKGERHWYAVPWSSVWKLAAGIRAEELKAERKAKRLARRLLLGARR